MIWLLTIGCSPDLAPAPCPQAASAVQTNDSTLGFSALDLVQGIGDRFSPTVAWDEPFAEDLEWVMSIAGDPTAASTLESPPDCSSVLQTQAPASIRFSGPASFELTGLVLVEGTSESTRFSLSLERAWDSPELDAVATDWLTSLRAERHVAKPEEELTVDDPRVLLSGDLQSGVLYILQPQEDHPRDGAEVLVTGRWGLP